MDAQEADAFVNVSASFVLLSEILRMLFWGEKKRRRKKEVVFESSTSCRALGSLYSLVLLMPSSSRILGFWL